MGHILRQSGPRPDHGHGGLGSGCPPVGGRCEARGGGRSLGRGAGAWLLVVWLLAADALAGGGVMLENDRCIITIGFYTAHFTAYQPESRGDREFCEDLPDAGQTVFVLDYLHRSLGEVPVDFRIIRDPTGLGRFLRWEDVAALGDLEPHTVFYQPPVTAASQSYRVSHRFAAPGAYVGIVTAGHPTKDTRYTAVFPFAVGQAGLSGPVLAVAGVLVLAAAAGAAWLGVGRGRARHEGGAAP